MDRQMHEPRDGQFALGLLIGACAGAAAVLWFAPRLRAELRQWLTDTAASVGVPLGEVVDESVPTSQAAADGTPAP
jgi:gas vesicle protein